MKLLPLAIALFPLLLALPAAAQLGPGGSPGPGDGELSNLPEELPAALGFTVERRTSSVEHRRRIFRYQTTEKFQDAARRLQDWANSDHAFGGFHFLGWSHQAQGDSWWFPLSGPKGPVYLIWLEPGEAGTALLCFDANGRSSPLSAVRRPWADQDELGPKP